MKNIFIAALIGLLPVGSHAAVLGQIPTLLIGGRTFTDLKNLIELVAFTSGSGAPTYGTFRLPNSSSGYAVTTGKTFTIAAVRWYNETQATVPSQLTACYGDTDIGISSTSAPTNVVYVGGAFITTFGAQAGTTLPTISETTLKFAVPAGKYPCVYQNQNSASLKVRIFGYEE